eukprot:NODE_187_length_15673_cov_0.222743.p8 type:complete len:144 gc:universal NODE_187_length_15673_cov_0.222743:11334-11765(+)
MIVVSIPLAFSRYIFSSTSSITCFLFINSSILRNVWSFTTLFISTSNTVLKGIPRSFRFIMHSIYTLLNLILRCCNSCLLVLSKWNRYLSSILTISPCPMLSQSLSLLGIISRMSLVMLSTCRLSGYNLTCNLPRRPFRKGIS